MIFHEKYPHLYPKPNLDSDDTVDDSDCYPIKFSNTWQRNFMKRHNFSFRKLGTKMNKKGKTPGMIEAIRDYHLHCRSLQLSPTPASVKRDPTFGFTSPHNVFLHDQVPLQLADSNEMTIDSTGADEIYDAVSSSDFEKRFATCNITVPMELREDKKNFPKAHVIFKGTFQSGDEWHDANERSQWHPDVVVSFQPKAWVDAQTHILGLKQTLGPVNAYLEEEGMRGVSFEGNLSSHQTKDVRP